MGYNYFFLISFTLFYFKFIKGIQVSQLLLLWIFSFYFLFLLSYLLEHFYIMEFVMFLMMKQSLISTKVFIWIPFIIIKFLELLKNLSQKVIQFLIFKFKLNLATVESILTAMAIFYNTLYLATEVIIDDGQTPNLYDFEFICLISSIIIMNLKVIKLCFLIINNLGVLYSKKLFNH